jgi:8-oxo-dGTP pyrophosphatase MutT (NUDIX family)
VALTSRAVPVHHRPRFHLVALVRRIRLVASSAFELALRQADGQHTPGANGGLCGEVSPQVRYHRGIMDDATETGDVGGGPKRGVGEMLRSALATPLEGWREVYKSFSPVDLETGERRGRVPPPGTDSRRAAVLVPVLPEHQGPRIVYTVRRDDLQDHAGQISFPGGSMDPADASLMETALREAEEEIDLSRDLVEIVGELEEMYIPPSNFRVSPFVGLLRPEAEMVLAPDEVEEIFTVSVEELLAPKTFRKVLWRRDGRDYEVPVFAVEGSRREIWGATAAITAALLARLGWDGYDA